MSASRIAKFVSALALSGALLLLCFSCSGEGDGTAADGDADSERLDENAEDDYDYGGDGDDDFEAIERPEAEQFVWEDETYGIWDPVPFCFKGKVHFKEDFEAEELSSRWNIDEKVPEMLNGTAFDTQPQILVNEDGNRFLSGRRQDIGPSTLPLSRLWMEIPKFDDPQKIINSYHALFRLPDRTGENLLWFHDDGDPTGTWLPELKITQVWDIPAWFTSGQAEPMLMSVNNYNDTVWGHLDGLDEGWHRVEIYDLSGGGWRVDIDRVTVAEFSYSFSAEHPLKTMFIGRDGNIDDIFMGDCPIPQKGLACKVADDCPLGMICGRDGVCYYSRNIVCKSNYQCDDESACIGISFGGDILGDGTCTVHCTRHADCRPYEICLPYSETDGFCRSLCEDEMSFCPDGQYCEVIGGVAGCLPETCRKNAEWVKQDNGLIECLCKSGYLENPFTGECLAEKKCGSQYDCADNERCRDELCYRIRDISCYDGSNNCPYGTSCYGVTVNGEIAGIGQCSVECYANSDCLPYEMCMWLETDQPHCVARCDENKDCDNNLQCINTPLGGACMPERCKQNAAWVWNDNTQSINCECREDYFTDTVSGACRKI